MQYAMLIYENPRAFATRDLGEEDTYFGAWRAYYRAMVEAGVYVTGSPLHLPESAATVRRNSDGRDVQDGPYANTKEQLGGFVILELPSLDAALDWAARCPAASMGAVEVRPVSPETHYRVTGEHL